MITYSRFPSTPPPASPCGRSKARPCQRQVAVGLCVPAPPWICDPASTHTTIIPAFYSASSAIPLDPLHLSRPLSCLTSPLLSPPLCIPKYPSSLPWLPLASPARDIWLGRRQDKHQPASQPSSSSADAKPEPETSLLFLRWELPFRSLSSSQLQICTKLARTWYACFNSFSSSFSLKFFKMSNRLRSH